MNGAESLIRTALGAGVEICFANPGTTEMPLVQALDTVGGPRAVLGLFEGVCTGAADGWARMRDRPAMTLLHLGPGFANGLANLHNARRAGSRVVNVVGDQPTWHLAADAPLTSDIEALAGTVSRWVRTSSAPGRLAADFADGLALATSPAGGVATLVAPADRQWEEAPGPAPPPAAAAATAVSSARLEAAAKRLREGGPAALLLGGAALREAGLEQAGRLAAACGAALFCETFPARIERGGDLPAPARLPYFHDQAREALAGFQTLLLAGAREPVAFFGYPDGQSFLAPEGSTLALANEDEDLVGALEALAELLDAPARAPAPQSGALPPAPEGALDPGKLGAVAARALPEGALVVDEGLTSSLPFWVLAGGARRHTTLTLTGGAIGQGPPCATGAALACPDRPVLALQADGSGLYTLQALWTQAREGLDVVTVVCANHRYRILQLELARAGVAEPGPAARRLCELGPPTVDWVALARGFGVPASRVETAEALAQEIERGLAERGPRLVEAVL